MANIRALTYITKKMNEIINRGMINLFKKSVCSKDKKIMIITAKNVNIKCLEKKK